LIAQWTPAFGSGSNALKQAVNFIVNPYDPSEIYVADAGDQKIKVSHDNGQTWQVQKTLTDIATVTDSSTNQPTFRFDCGYPGNPTAPGRGQGVATGLFANACALSDVAFDRSQPDIRVAALYPGGLAFSNDAGRTWTPLDVTNSNPATSKDLMELPVSVFYDGESASNGMATIYVALRGPSIIAITGPFTGPPAPTNCFVDIVTCGHEATLVWDPLPIWNSLFLGARRNHTLQSPPDFHPGGSTPPMLPSGANVVYDAPIAPEDNEFEACDVDPSFRRS
jgi:hypothetical protein